MVIIRETDPVLANRLSNDPDVVGNVSYDGRVVDWTPLVDLCVILSNQEDGVQVYEQREPRIWEVITIFGKSCRGKRALETAYAMRDWMLPYVDTCFGAVPDRLKAAKWFYRKLGGVPVGDTIETRNFVYRAKPGETFFQFGAI